MNSSNPAYTVPPGVYGDIFNQYADNASFLWILRSIAVNQSDYHVDDIGRLDRRIDAQLQGLTTSVEQGWEACLESLSLDEPGEVFTATVVAFASRDPKKIQHAVESGLANSETARGLISALGWLSPELVNFWIKEFLTSKDLDHKYLALAACSVRRQDPGDGLEQILLREDCRQHERLYARALRLIGELGRVDLLPLLQQAMQSEFEAVRFWANWSAILIGDYRAASNLKPFVLQTGDFQDRAIEICFRVLAVEEGRKWIMELGKQQDQVRSVIKASAALGDPHAVGWLITRMEQPAISRICGEAFSRITGIDLLQNQLGSEDRPFAEEESPDDEEFVALDEDENLPWPDTARIKALWNNHGGNFTAGKRYFSGRPVTPDYLAEKLVSANQRQRRAAALELALLESASSLTNISASRVT